MISLFFNSVERILKMNAMSKLFIGNGQEQNDWSLGNCYYLMYCSSIMLVPKLSEDTDRKRILFLGTVVSGMMLYWLWEARLISYYVVPTKDFPFNTLEEFLTRTSKKVS